MIDGCTAAYALVDGGVIFVKKFLYIMIQQRIYICEDRLMIW